MDGQDRTEAIDECCVQYQTRNADPRARIVRCGLPSGHAGPHCEEPGAPEWDNPPAPTSAHRPADDSIERSRRFTEHEKRRLENDFDRAQELDASYRRGFAVGRRRAAEDVAKLINAATGETRNVYLLAVQVALHGPQDVSRSPRSWSLPVIPDDVTRVRDNVGDVWCRSTAFGRPTWRHEAGGVELSVGELLAGRSPLTEVTEEQP